MGKRGPAPAPTNLKLLRGESRPSRVNRHEPQPPLTEVVPPAFLDQEMVAVWLRLAPSLEQRGVLTVWDAETFAVFCVAVVLHRRALAVVLAEEMVVDGHHGGRVKHPMLQVV